MAAPVAIAVSAAAYHHGAEAMKAASTAASRDEEKRRNRASSISIESGHRGSGENQRKRAAENLNVTTFPRSAAYTVRRSEIIKSAAKENNGENGNGGAHRQ